MSSVSVLPEGDFLASAQVYQQTYSFHPCETNKEKLANFTVKYHHPWPGGAG